MTSNRDTKKASNPFVKNNNNGGDKTPNNSIGNSNADPSLKPEFTASSQSVYVFDDIPVHLKRSDGNGYSHSIEKHAPWSDDGSRHNSAFDMFHVKQKFIEENGDILRKAMDKSVISGKNKIVDGYVTYNGEEYYSSFKCINGQFYEVTSYKNNQ